MSVPRVSQKVVFLDRDGTLNVDSGYVVRHDEWLFCDGACEAIRKWNEAGFLIFVVSNQSGVGRGYFSRSEVDDLHVFVAEEVRRKGAAIDGFAYCPHLPSDECLCRKPKVGLASQIEAALGGAIDFARSWTIGDKLSDLEFGNSLGTHSALLHSRYWCEADLNGVTRQPECCATTLFEATRLILP